MHTISQVDCSRNRADGCGAVVPMPFADRLASHMLLGDMVILGVKRLARFARETRWGDDTDTTTAVPRCTTGHCVH